MEEARRAPPSIAPRIWLAVLGWGKTGLDPDWSGYVAATKSMTRADTPDGAVVVQG